MRWVWALAFLGLVGCGGTDEMMPVGGGPETPRELPDGFIQESCLTNGDCDDGNPCTDDACPAAWRSSTHAAKDCTSFTDQCNAGTCDEPTGDCLAAPVADGSACMAANSDPGQKVYGVYLVDP